MSALDDITRFLAQERMIPDADGKRLSVSVMISDVPRDSEKLSKRYVVFDGKRPLCSIKMIPRKWVCSVDDILNARRMYAKCLSFKVPDLYGHFSTQDGHFFVEKYLVSAVGLHELVARRELLFHQAYVVVRDIFRDIWMVGEPASAEFIQGEKRRYRRYFQSMIESAALCELIADEIDRIVDDHTFEARETWSTGDIIDRNILRVGNDWYLVDYEYSHRTIFLFKDAYRCNLYARWAKNGALGGMCPWVVGVPDWAVKMISLAWENDLYGNLVDHEAQEFHRTLLRPRIRKILEVERRRAMNPHGGGRTADATDPLPVTADVREVGFRKDHGRLRETSFLEKASRGLVGAARRLGLRKGLVTSDGGGGSDDPYEQWIARNERDGGDRAAVQLEIRAWALQPKVSLITLVFNPSRYALTRCLESVLAQVYPHWELCLVDGGSTHDDVRAVIQEYAARDSRIRPLMLPENWGIAGNSNAALKMASGEYVGLLDYDDTLAPVALYDVVKLVNESPEVDLVYSDEDKIAPLDETRFHPIFKPGWSPDTFLSHNFPCHFTVIRKAFVDEVGGFRLGYDGSQDYDLFLRVAQLTNKIQHIPKVLYHWRTSPESAAGDQLAKPYALDAAKRAIGEYLRGQRLDAQVVDGKFPTSYRVRYVIRGRPKVSIIIPTRDKTPLLKRCVSSILARTEYPEFEILIVDNGSTEQAALDYLRALEEDRKIRVMSYDQPFNFSAINNFAVRSVTSDLLLFLNNDTEVVSPEWLSAMLEFAQRDDIGAVGAKLYYYDDTVQHGGVVIGLGGIADHAHRGFPRLSNGYLGRLNVIQNVSAVSAACMMMRRKVFEEVGGFEERLSYCYNDVDLCLKIREKGYLIVFTPYAELYHHESARGGSQGREATSEGRDLVGKEQAFIKDKWRGVLAAGDPYYSPNLTLEKYDFSPRI